MTQLSHPTHLHPTCPNHSALQWQLPLSRTHPSRAQDPLARLSPSSSSPPLVWPLLCFLEGTIPPGHFSHGPKSPELPPAPISNLLPRKSTVPSAHLGACPTRATLSLRPPAHAGRAAHQPTGQPRPRLHLPPAQWVPVDGGQGRRFRPWSVLTGQQRQAMCQHCDWGQR